MYGNRYRSGSVGRQGVGGSSSVLAGSSSVSAGPSSVYKSPYGSLSTGSAGSSRYSRAASCDPLSSSIGSSSYSRPLSSGISSARPSAGLPSHMSHSDFAPIPYSTRFGSTDRLVSSLSGSLTQRPPSYPMGTSRFNPSSSSYARAPEPRNYVPSSSFFSPSSGRSLPFSSSSGYPSSRLSFDVRSKTPGFSSEGNKTNSSIRRDRDYRSVSRFEAYARDTTPAEKDEDDVEKTFQKLYNRYARDASSSSIEEEKGISRATHKVTMSTPRRFIFHSEAEEETEEEESPEEVESFSMDTLKRKKAPSVSDITEETTPRCSAQNSPSKELTPVIVVVKGKPANTTPLNSPSSTKEQSTEKPATPPSSLSPLPKAVSPAPSSAPSPQKAASPKPSTPAKIDTSKPPASSSKATSPFPSASSSTASSHVSSPTKSTSPSPSKPTSSQPRPSSSKAASHLPNTSSSKTAAQPSPTKAASPLPPSSPSPKPSTTLAKAVSPAPSPSKAVSPAPSPSKAVSPAPSPSKAVSPAPSPSKAVSPAPSPSKAVSPAPSPSKAVSPTPSPTKAASPAPPPNVVDAFKEKFSDVEMKPVVFPSRNLQSPSSQMSKLLKNTSAIAALEKKASTPTREVTHSMQDPAKSMRSRTASPAPKTTADSSSPYKETAKTDTSPISSATVKTAKAGKSTEKEATPARIVAKTEPSPLASSTMANQSMKKEEKKPPAAVALKVTTRAKSEIFTEKNTTTPKKSAEDKAKTEEKKMVTRRSASPAKEVGKLAVGSTGTKLLIKKDAIAEEGKKRSHSRSRSRTREPSTSVSIILEREASVPPPESSSRTASSPSPRRSTKEEKSSASRKDRTGRTLDALKDELHRQSGDEPKPRDAPPLLLVTQPSMPSTPVSVSASYNWQDARSDGSDQDDGDETEVDDTDTEFCVSQTFRIEKPRVNLELLAGRSSSRSPFGIDYESDVDITAFLASSTSGRRESRCRVEGAMIQPPPILPIFTASVTYDGQPYDEWDSARENDSDSFDDCGSRLAAYLSPAIYTSDENSLDGEHFRENVAVGCTLTLVQKAALKDTDDESYSDWDSEEYTDESYWDEDEEYDEDEDESFDEEDEKEEQEMRSAEDSQRSSPTTTFLVIRAAEAAEEFALDDVDGEFAAEASFEKAEPVEMMEVADEKAEKKKELTYTKEQPLQKEEEEARLLEEQRQEEVKARIKRQKKDGRSETVDMCVVASSVSASELVVEEAEAEEMLAEEAGSAEYSFLPELKGDKEVNVTPTFVKATEEKVKAEETSRFADKKPTTDHAKKAVIQPAKLQKAAVTEVQAKMAAPPQPKKVETPQPSEEKKKEESVKAAGAKPKEQAAPAGQAAGKPSPGQSSSGTSAEPSKTTGPSGGVAMEDKAAVRKSALNMNVEDARKKEEHEKEAAAAKARRLGTVGSLASRFKEPEAAPQAAPVTYKRSSRLESKEIEWPKRTYEIVKPVINDEFDKQVAELREKMKSGSSQLQSQYKDLTKGIMSSAEEAKLKELEEKKKALLNKASGVFGVAEEEKRRWKEQRDAETEKELARIEAEKSTKRRVVSVEKKEAAKPDVKPEPKRTVRKINRDKSPAAEKQEKPAQPPPPPPSAAASLAPPPNWSSRKTENEASATPPVDVPHPRKIIPKPISLSSGPKIPEMKITVDDNNAALFEAVSAVATKRKKSIAELRETKELIKREKLEELRQSKAATQGDGAAATKIRNAKAAAMEEISLAGEKSSQKRYSNRRKTQELVNPSQQRTVQRRRRRRIPGTRGRFIRRPHDIDVLLGWQNDNSFEALEKKFAAAANDKLRVRIEKRRHKRCLNDYKIWISELTDIDKIYKASELRDIQASVG